MFHACSFACCGLNTDSYLEPRYARYPWLLRLNVVPAIPIVYADPQTGVLASINSANEGDVIATMVREWARTSTAGEVKVWLGGSWHPGESVP